MAQSDDSVKKVDAVDAQMVSAVALYRLGWTQPQIAQVFGKSTPTICRWVKAVTESGDYDISGLPSERMAIDRLMSMIPDALNRYHNTILHDERRGLDAARDVLRTFNVVRDKVEIAQTDLTHVPDSELIADIERLLAQGKERSGASDDGTEEA